MVINSGDIVRDQIGILDRGHNATFMILAENDGEGLETFECMEIPPEDEEIDSETFSAANSDLITLKYIGNIHKLIS